MGDRFLNVIAGLTVAVVIGGSAAAAVKTVTIAQGVDPEVLDPAYDTLISSVSTMSNIYDTLIWREANGDLVPALAESWTFPVPAQLRMVLRKNVKWHDGTDFTAADVVFSLKRYVREKEPVPFRTYLVTLIKDAEAVDDHTVIIHMPGPNATILPNLARVPILPRKVLETKGDAAFGQSPVGTGPFKFVKWDKNQQIVLEAFDGHWRGRPNVDRLVIKPVPEDFARFAALRTGEVDIIVNLSSDRAEEIKANPKLKVGAVHSVRNMFVGMNIWKKPFDDVRVRRAMNHAVDVQAIVDAVLGGRAYVNPSVCSEPIFGFSKVQPYEYDPAKAKQLLAQAGYPNGFDVILWGTNGRYPKDKEVQEAIAGQLSAIGVRVTHNMPEWAEFWGSYRTKKIDSMSYLGTGNPVLDCDATMGYRIHGKRGGWYYNTPEVDALIEKQEVELDVAKRKEIFREIQQRIRDDAPWIFLFDLQDLYGMTARIDWQPRPDELIWAYAIKVKE